MKHRQFTDYRWWYVYSSRTSKKEYSLFLAKTAVDKSHCELWIKISIRSDTSDLKINIICLNKISKQTLHTYNLNLFMHITCNLTYQLNSFLDREDWTKDFQLIIATHRLFVLVATPMYSLSQRDIPRLIMSRWPLVGGSNVPA